METIDALGLTVNGEATRVPPGTHVAALLDRAIALDVLLAIVGAAVAVEMAYNRHLDNLVLLVIVSLIGFLGSVTLARFTNPGK